MPSRRTHRCLTPWLLALVSVAVAGCDSGVEHNMFVDMPRGVTYHADVAPLLSGACGECHGAQPDLVAFDTYEDAVHWSRVIGDALLENTFPPCDPSSEMTDEDIEVFLSWVEDGTPAGPLPPAPIPGG